MGNKIVLDPSASPLDYYACELRRYREYAGLTQSALAKIINYSDSRIAQIETARTVPTYEFSERVDAALDTGGALSRMMDLVLRSQLPAWFRQIAELEARATEIFAFQTHIVHGLLQTEGYARAVLGSVIEDDLDNRVAARMARQRILAKEEPPFLWVVLCEGALYQEVGGRDVMRQQMAHLLDFDANSRVNIQVLPFSAGAHAGTPGSFSVFRFEKDPAVVYTEGYGTHYASANPHEVREISLRYDHLQAAALSLRDSAKLIRKTMEERYAEQPESG